MQGIYVDAVTIIQYHLYIPASVSHHPSRVPQLRQQTTVCLMQLHQSEKAAEHHGRIVEVVTETGRIFAHLSISRRCKCVQCSPAVVVINVFAMVLG